VSYQAKLSRESEKNLDRLDQPTCARIERRINELKVAPFDPRISKRLKGAEGMRSSRVGDWRILYTADPQRQILPVIAIRPRGEAYRHL